MKCHAVAMLLAALPGVASGKHAGPAIEPGTFLVSDPALSDPNFARSVVLILDRGESGTMGIMINRETTVGLESVLPDRDISASCPCPIHLGGPIATEAVLTLVRAAKRPEESQRVFGDVYLVALDDGLEAAAAGVKARFYAGHAGWAPGQLEQEIAAGAWHVVRGSDRHVFDLPAERVWPLLAATDVASASEAPEIEQDALAVLADLDQKVEGRGLAGRGLAHEAAEADAVLHRHHGPREALEQLVVVGDDALVDA
ncbi:MAG: YqgE/AlgH family protein [Acidobacteriota bacterium]